MGYSVMSATGEFIIEWDEERMSTEEMEESEKEIAEKSRLWIIKNGEIAADIAHDNTWVSDYYSELVSIIEAIGTESACVWGWVVLVGEDGHVRKFVVEGTKVFQYGLTSGPCS